MGVNVSRCFVNTICVETFVDVRNMPYVVNLPHPSITVASNNHFVSVAI